MALFENHPERYGYLILAVCFSLQAIGIGILFSYGLFFNPLMAEFGWSRALISGASSLAFFMMGFIGILAGRLNDRFGPRILMTVAAVFFGAGYMLMSRLSAPWQIYCFYGLLWGMGLGAFDVIPLSTIARWFTYKRGLMTGIVKVGTGAGQFTMPLIVSFVIAGYGWRNAFFIVGLAVMIILVLIAQLLRRDPGQMGLPPDWNRKKNDDSPEENHAIGLTYSKALRTVQLWTVCTVSTAMIYCLMSMVLHIVPHCRDIGLSASLAASVLSSIGGVSMLGRFLTGIAIDYIGSKRMMVLCFILLIIGLLWLQTADTPWMLYVFAFIYGLAHGGFYTTVSPIVAELFGIRSHGALFGIVACSGTIGGGIGPVVTGYIFDVRGSYDLAFWLITAFSAVGLALIMTLKPVPSSDETPVSTT